MQMNMDFWVRRGEQVLKMISYGTANQIFSSIRDASLVLDSVDFGSCSLCVRGEVKEVRVSTIAFDFSLLRLVSTELLTSWDF